MGRVISVANRAVELVRQLRQSLAAALAVHGKKVLIIDSDLKEMRRVVWRA